MAEGCGFFRLAGVHVRHPLRLPLWVLDRRAGDALTAAAKAVDPREARAAEILAVLELISATEALVQSCLTVRSEKVGLSPSAEIRATVFCKICVRAGVAGQPIDHAPSCIVGHAVAAVAAVRPALVSTLPTFCGAEVEALRTMDAREPAAEAARAAVGFNGHAVDCEKRRFGCWGEAGVCSWGHRCTCGADILRQPPHAAQVIVYERGKDYGRVATHEEAAAHHAAALGEKPE